MEAESEERRVSFAGIIVGGAEGIAHLIEPLSRELEAQGCVRRAWIDLTGFPREELAATLASVDATVVFIRRLRAEDELEPLRGLLREDNTYVVSLQSETPLPEWMRPRSVWGPAGFADLAAVMSGRRDAATRTESNATPPMPENGPRVYISYARREPARNAIVGDVAKALRRMEIRAQIDVLDGELGVEQAIAQSEWFVLVIDERYVQGPDDPPEEEDWTGVDPEIHAIEQRVLLDPFIRERVVPVVVGDVVSAVGEAALPRVVLGLDRISVATIGDPYLLAEKIRDRVARAGHVEPRELPVSAFETQPQSEQVTAILASAEWITRGGNREPWRVSIAALLLAMLHEGKVRADEILATAWLAQLAEKNGVEIRTVATRYFPRWNSSAFGNPRSSDTTAPLAHPLDYETYSLVLWAWLLAQRTALAGDFGKVRGSHLLFALLHRKAPWTNSVDRMLKELRFDVDQLFRQLRSEMSEWDLPGDLGLWRLWDRRVSSRPQRKQEPWAAHQDAAAFGADDARTGDDHLDITPDVEAFAKVLAAWKLEPPLALGLFGDWGSGKSFFMRRLRQEIERLSTGARKDTRAQKELPYCKYVVQVEFNAWHYSEGDLWACLVDHIFTNLRLTDKESETEVARRRKAMLAQMQVVQKAGEAAEAGVQEADRAIAEARKEVEAAKQRLESAKQEFTQLSVADIWATVTKDEKLRATLKEYLARIGYDKANLETAKEILSAVEDARSLAGRTRATITFLGSQLKNPYAWLAFLIAFGVPAGLFALGMLVPNYHASLAAFVSSVLTAAAGFVPIYRAFAGHVHDALEQLDKPRRMAEAARRLELEGLEQRISKLALEKDEAQRRKDELDEQKRGLSERIEALNADRMLAEFLQERAATDDYRKKLGTLALIRRDFERLADLMKSQRDDVESGRAPTDGVPDDLRVNRIVLYIDDLDRCHPKQVLEVLQAIHLLLAFPLFVVVVGVDARWVYASIRERYKGTIRDGNVDGQSAAFSMPEGIATPRDYLEKIFQVPFWLKTMGLRTCQDLMAGLLASEVSRSGVRAAVPDRTVVADAPSPKRVDAPRPEVAEPTRSPAPKPEPAPAPKHDDAALASAPAAAETPKSKQPSPSSKPPLDVTAAELEWMQSLAGIVGRSPRAVKRFINCYRLFKAVVPDGCAETFVMARSPELASDAEVALSLLALVVGEPSVAAALLDELARAEPDEKLGDPGVRLRRRSPTGDLAAALTRVENDGLLGRLSDRAGDRKLAELHWIVDRAARFSFQTASIEQALNVGPAARSSSSPRAPADARA